MENETKRTNEEAEWTSKTVKESKAHYNSIGYALQVLVTVELLHSISN